jgi:hypothetical protein
VNKPVPPPISGRKPFVGAGAKAAGLPTLGRQAPAPKGTRSSSGSNFSGKLNRPPLAPVFASLVLLGIGVWLITKDRNQIGVHLVGSLLGMFGSVVVLGWFRQSLNLRLSSNSFSEWAGPFESTKYMSVSVAASWVLGVIHLYFSVYEILRPGG